MCQVKNELLPCASIFNDEDDNCFWHLLSFSFANVDIRTFSAFGRESTVVEKIIRNSNANLTPFYAVECRSSDKIK
jgi:hypothetical protein